MYAAAEACAQKRHNVSPGVGAREPAPGFEGKTGFPLRADGVQTLVSRLIIYRTFERVHSLTNQTFYMFAFIVPQNPRNARVNFPSKFGLKSAKYCFFIV